MEPFRVTLELAEPVLVNRNRPVSFDGLLAHLNFLRTGDAATAHRSLPLADTGGIHQGSELLFLGPVMRRKVPWVMNPRWDRFHHGELVDKRGKPRNKMTARDEFKPTRDDYIAVSARRAFFIGVGDVGAVEALMNGLDAVGKKSRSRGFGRLAESVRIDPIDDAPDGIGYSDFERRPIRVVPVGIWERLQLPTEDVSFGPARPRLPRWATEDELCALPASHVIEPHELHRIGL